MLFRLLGTQLAFEIAHRKIVESEAALSGADKVGGQRDIGGHSGQPPAPAGEVVHRSLGLMQRFRLVLVGQPGTQCRFIIGRQGGGVDIGAVAVGGRDGHCGGVAVISRVRSHHRETRTCCAAGVFSQPGGHRPRFQRAASHIEAVLNFGFGGGQRVEQPVAQHPELEVVEELMDLVAIPGQQTQGVGCLGQGHVAHQMGEFAVEQHGGQVLAQRIPDFAPHVLHVVHQALQ